MKLIDEKGRFFGKINFIDVFVILLLVFLLSAICYKLLGPNLPDSGTTQGEVTATVKCTFKTESVAKSFTKGQTLVFGTDYIPDAKITDVSYTPSDYITSDAQGNARLVKHPLLKDILITIQAKVNTKAPILKIGTQELCTGKKFTVKTHTQEVDGSVESILLN